MKLKRPNALLLAALALLSFTFPLLLSGCREEVTQSGDPVLNTADTVIAVLAGTPTESCALAAYPAAQFVYVNNDTDGMLAVASGKADAFAVDLGFFENALATGTTGLHVHEDGIIRETGEVAAAVSPKTEIPDAAGKINAFLAEMQQNGTMDDMLRRWTVEHDYQMPDIAIPESPDYTIRVGTTGLAEPYSFYADQTLSGYDIELIYRFALWCNAALELKVYDWAGLDAACLSGKVDYVLSNYYVTPEKQEIMTFSDPYMTLHTVMAVADRQAAAASDVALNGPSASIAVVADSVIENAVREAYPLAHLVYVQSASDAKIAVTAGKVTAMAIDKSELDSILSAGNAGMHMHSDGIIGSSGEVAVGISKNSSIPDAKKKIDRFLADLRADGTLENMRQRWQVNHATAMPEIPVATSPAYTIHLGTTGMMEPFTFYADGQLSGFDIELMQRFAYWCDAVLVIDLYDWSGIISACASGKADYIASHI